MLQISGKEARGRGTPIKLTANRASSKFKRLPAKDTERKPDQLKPTMQIFT